jgi:hypothetical protein
MLRLLRCAMRAHQNFGHAACQWLDVSTALPRWQREVMGQIEKHWGKAVQRFAAVFVVGGSVYLIRDASPAKFKDKLVIPDDPILSIARLLPVHLFQVWHRSRLRSRRVARKPNPSQEQPWLIIGAEIRLYA